VHEKWQRRANVINLGVDQWDFRPRSLAELLQSTPREGLNSGSGPPQLG
jgi:hypothetical protein